MKKSTVTLLIACALIITLKLFLRSPSLEELSVEAAARVGGQTDDAVLVGGEPAPQSDETSSLAER